MIFFNNDYSEGAHERVLDCIIKANMEQSAGYGQDAHCANAARLIKNVCGAEQADVHFAVGGTQANLIVCAAILRPWQGVISADSGHVNTHETGAIEACGHKVLPIVAHNGKLRAKDIDSFCAGWENDPAREHVVAPGMVYISQPTELGTVYSKKELSDISAVCRAHGLYLYCDGARLGYALCSPGNDVSLRDMAALCDVFYIGGTKVGALFGEAIVIQNDDIKPSFRAIMKQKGALLAKGRLLGLQFEALFTDELYMRISRHAIEQAMAIHSACADMGIGFFIDSPTNQQFILLTDAQYERLSRNFTMEPWQRTKDGLLAVRICTSWATDPANVFALTAALRAVTA